MQEYAENQGQGPSSPPANFENKALPKGIWYGLAEFFSLILHPMLMASYVSAWLIFEMKVLPYGKDAAFAIFLMIIAFTVLLPGMATLVLWRFKVISSLSLEHQKERTLPYLAGGLVYLAGVISLYKYLFISIDLFNMMVALTIGIFLTAFANLFIKISAHSVGIGGLSGFVFTLAYFLKDDLMYYPLLVVIMASGVLLSSRLYLGKHNMNEISLGYFLGFSVSCLITLMERI